MLRLKRMMLVTGNDCNLDTNKTDFNNSRFLHFIGSSGNENVLVVIKGT